MLHIKLYPWLQQHNCIHPLVFCIFPKFSLLTFHQTKILGHENPESTMFSLYLRRIFDLQVLISYQLSLSSFRKSTQKLFGLLRTTQRNPYLCIWTLLQDPLIQDFLLMWHAWVTNAMVPKWTLTARSSHLTHFPNIIPNGYRSILLEY